MAATAGRIALIAAWVVVVGGVAAGAGYLHTLGPPDEPKLAGRGGDPPRGSDLPQLSPPTAHDQAPPADAVATAPPGTPPDGPADAAEPAPEHAPPAPEDHAEPPAPPALTPLEAPHTPPEGPAVAEGAADAPELALATEPDDAAGPVAPTLPPLVTPPPDTAHEAPPDTAPGTHPGAPETAGPEADRPETADHRPEDAPVAAPESVETADAADDPRWPVTTPALHGPMPTVEPRPFDLAQPGHRAEPPQAPAEGPPPETPADAPADAVADATASGADDQTEDAAPAPPPPQLAEAEPAPPLEAPIEAVPAPETPREEPAMTAAVEPAHVEVLDGDAGPAEAPAAPGSPAVRPDAPGDPAEEAQEHAAAAPPAPPPTPAPVVPADGPMVAIVIGGLGLNSAATEAAIQDLPAAVTLSFSPYSSRLGDWVARARAAGHEVLLDLPMEPADFPVSDPGPQALMTGLDTAENLRRLDWVLSRSDAIVGVASYMGSRFAADAEAMRPVLEEIRSRGLIYLDAGQAAGGIASALGSELGLPILVSDLEVDPMAARQTVDDALARVEDMAQRDGEAVAVGTAYPVTIERVAGWARRLGDGGVALAPVSALAGRR